MSVKVQQDQTVTEGFALSEEDGEPVLRVRVGTVIGERELMMLAVILSPFWPQVIRAGAKLTQVL